MKNNNRKNMLFIVPNLKKLKGGPVSRISDFKKVFERKGQLIIESKKIWKSLNSPKLNIIYVESASNRIGFSDFLSLLILKTKSKKTIVFIRDIYIELFPEEYTGFRKSITKYCNKVSNLFLCCIADELAFPTHKMGEVFFEKNSQFPLKKHFSLPPATVFVDNSTSKTLNLNKKLGVIFLGGTKYKNSGIEKFIEISKNLHHVYNFFVLTPDNDLRERLDIPEYVIIQEIKREEITNFIKNKNISAAYHTRPKNFYDDITFPIKVLDFLAFQIPFLTERHTPLEDLLGKDYDLFVNWEILEDVKRKTEDATIFREKHLKRLSELSAINTYENRYIEIIQRDL
jgi:hypothetical protein